MDGFHLEAVVNNLGIPLRPGPKTTSMRKKKLNRDISIRL